jgi:hypothetical protein
MLPRKQGHRGCKVGASVARTGVEDETSGISVRRGSLRLPAVPAVRPNPPRCVGRAIWRQCGHGRGTGSCFSDLPSAHLAEARAHLRRAPCRPSAAQSTGPADGVATAGAVAVDPRGAGIKGASEGPRWPTRTGIVRWGMLVWTAKKALKSCSLGLTLA